MIRAQDFAKTLANITPHQPVDLDAALGLDGAEPSNTIRRAAMPLYPPTTLWQQPDDSVTYIGIRVDGPIDAPEHLAARLCAAAIERQVIPVFLSTQASCDMLRFGFRVEMICGQTEAIRAEQEAQIRQMWNLALVINISDAAQLG
jgi:hypothetical protein